jgi:hypothetical protein
MLSLGPLFPWSLTLLAALALGACSSSSSTSGEDGAAPPVGTPAADAAPSADGAAPGDDQEDAGDAGAGDGSSPRGDGGEPLRDAAGHDAADAGPTVEWFCLVATNAEPFCGTYPHAGGGGTIDAPEANCSYGDAGANDWACGLRPGYPAFPCAIADACTQWIEKPGTGLTYTTGVSTHACAGPADCAGAPSSWSCKALPAGSYCAP